MQTRTVVDLITIEPQTGNVGVRMRKEIRDDSGSLMTFEYHRTMIAPDTDVALQMAAVNAHLVKMSYPAVKTEERSVLDSAIASIAPLRESKTQGRK